MVEINSGRRPPGPRATWLAVARRVTAGSPAATPEAEARFLALVAERIAARPGLALPIALYVNLVRWLPVLRSGARFENLSPEHQDDFLRELEKHPVGPLRLGFTGLRTFIYMGHYGRPDIGPEIRYTPSRAGNERLRRG